MMGNVDSEEGLHNLLSNLNISASYACNDEKKIEQLIMQLGDLSSRYSDLATKYLQLLNTKGADFQLDPNFTFGVSKNPQSSSTIEKGIVDVLGEFNNEVSDCLAPSQYNAATGKFSGDLTKAVKAILQSLKSKRVENLNLNEVIKSLEQKCENLELSIRQIETEKLKMAESRVRNEFFSEFEGLIKEDLKKTHILQQKINESLVLLRNSSYHGGDTTHLDAIFDSILTELNLQEHLKKMIEKMNSRRLKQDQEIDTLCEKISSMENTVIQCEREKMLFQNQKRLFENEKQELLSKVQKVAEQVKEEQELIKKLQIELENKKSAYSALTKAFEMNKNTLDQMKRKDSMVKKHISLQDTDLGKLKQRISDQERQVKLLRDEIQQKTQTLIAVTSDKDRLMEQLHANSALSTQYEESNKKIQSLSSSHELEINKLQGLLRSKQEEKDQIVASYSKLIKAYEGAKSEFSSLKADNLKLRERLDKLKTQSLPSDLKAEFEKEFEFLKSENQRLRHAFESAEVEKKKWRELMDIDAGRSNTLAAKISALESENENMRRNGSLNFNESNLLSEERLKNRQLEAECEKLTRKVWELTDQFNRMNDEQYRVAELLRNNWSAQSIRVDDRLGDQTMDSFVSPLQNKVNRRTEASLITPDKNSGLGSEHKYFEDENRRLMEIVAQVKSDLRQAASQSPSTSVFSP